SDLSSGDAFSAAAKNAMVYLYRPITDEEKRLFSADSIGITSVARVRMKKGGEEETYIYTVKTDAPVEGVKEVWKGPPSLMREVKAGKKCGPSWKETSCER
ncbi:MAG: hypothetical protein V1721_00480, partial [Pseudomonadota bacterium]